MYIDIVDITELDKYQRYQVIKQKTTESNRNTQKDKSTRYRILPVGNTTQN